MTIDPVVQAKSPQGECPSGTMSDPVAEAKAKAGESPAQFSHLCPECVGRGYVMLRTLFGYDKTVTCAICKGTGRR